MKKRKSKNLFKIKKLSNISLVLIIIIGVLAIACAAYFLFFNEKNESNTNIETQMKKCEIKYEGQEYMINDSELCTKIGGVQCERGKQAFSDDCGCGCELIRAKPVGSIDKKCLEVAEAGNCKGSIIKYYYDAVSGDCKQFVWGGCEGNAPFDTLGECVQLCEPTNFIYPKTYCLPEDRKVISCIASGNPVCGWFNKSIQCVKYPCAQTYNSGCSACINMQVEFWTPARCPI